MISQAVEPKTKADQEKMGLALQRLAREDPSFRVSTDEESGQTIISGMGELHLEIIVDRMKREFKVEANVGKPQVAYRETIRGTVPKEYIPGVEKGLKLAKESGVIAGFPMIDFKATLTDGQYHDVDSNVMTFDIAARACFREGIPKAGPKLLEPMMKVEVVTPEDYMGDVIGDLNSRRGQVQGMDSRGNAQVVSAMVPLANMFGYVNTLRSMSQGRAQFTMHFDHYERVPQAVADEVRAKMA